MATADKIGNWQKFKWLELPPAEDMTGQVVRDIALRPWAGSGDLIGTIASTDGVEFGLTGLFHFRQLKSCLDLGQTPIQSFGVHFQ